MSSFSGLIGLQERGGRGEATRLLGSHAYGIEHCFFIEDDDGGKVAQLLSTISDLCNLPFKAFASALCYRDSGKTVYGEPSL